MRVAAVPAIRIRAVNQRPERGDGAHVLYWMTAYRRTRWNFALQRAVERARALGRPLVVLEALRCGHRWASDRFHALVAAGMADNAAACARAGVAYHAYLEPAADAGKGLLAALAERACLVVTDDWPCFFLPRMLAAAAAALAVRLEAVDGNGLLPLRAVDRAFPTAHAFRRALQAELPMRLGEMPAAEPLAALERAPIAIERAIVRRWPAVSPALLAGRPDALAGLPIDHAVPPIAIRGGMRAARRRLADFLREDLAAYAGPHHPDEGRTSRLSPYLHWGQLSAHEAVAAVLARAGWSPDRLGSGKRGSRVGWWGVDAASEAFLDELVTWREVGFNACAWMPAYDTWGSLPAWARATLEAHARDPRPAIYPFARLEAAETGDELWNAAQRQLRVEGRIHGYLRMLWGKRVLEWTRHPRDALATLLALNDRWAADGRDPNSVSGILWTFGRYDRPWGPQRAVYGTVRYMSSANTARKLRLREYLARWRA